uniref:Cystatin domain-containing protein n=1 Tax=Scleropages formosus TaxID=113540 RepID=A0A8C9VT01_SCLFO
LWLIFSQLFCRSHSWLTSKVSNNDPRVRNAMLIGIYAFNNQSNDKFLFKVSHIKDAHIQIVKGIKFLLEANISRTVCLKREPSPDLDKCNFQPLGKLHKIFNCHFEVWAIPWKHWMKNIFFMCHP